MHTELIDTEPHLWRLVPDTELEQHVIGHVLSNAVAAHKTAGTFAEDEADMSAIWSTRGAVDEEGFGIADVILQRPAPDAPDDGSIESLLTETLARLKARTFLLVDHNGEPRQLLSYYELPAGDWAVGSWSEIGSPPQFLAPWRRATRGVPPLARRIEDVYRALQGVRSPRGARAWFARQAKVEPGTVSTWLSGKRPFDGPPLAVLELLEQMAAGRPRMSRTAAHPSRDRLPPL